MKLQIGALEKVAVAGMNNTGKTAICRLMERQARPNVAVWDPLGQYPPDVAYRPRPLIELPEDEARSMRRGEFDRFVRAVYFDPPKRLIVEEAEQVLTQGAGLPIWFSEYSMPGRNLGLAWTLNLRAPQLVDKAALNLVNRWFIFKLEGTSVDWMRARVGRHNVTLFDEMLRWRIEEHRFFQYYQGDLVECEALPERVVLELERGAKPRRAVTRNDGR